MVGDHIVFSPVQQSVLQEQVRHLYLVLLSFRRVGHWGPAVEMNHPTGRASIPGSQRYRGSRASDPVGCIQMASIERRSRWEIGNGLILVGLKIA